MFEVNIMLEETNAATGFIQYVLSLSNQIQFLGIKLINEKDFIGLIMRFTLNTILIYLIVHFIYARNSRRKDFYFSYLAIGVIVFFLSSLLNNVKLELGFALGLFAIFGIIRYRTNAIPIKEMTYLFVVIGISVINALSNGTVSFAELMFTNFIILIVLWALEKRLILKQEGSVKLIYENLENTHKNREDILLADLKRRTGINIKRYEIKRLDYAKNEAEITVFYDVNGKRIK